MKLSKLNTLRKTTNTLYILFDNEAKYFVKCYTGSGSYARNAQERSMMKHWKKNGFNVPDVYDRKVHGLQEPYIVTSFIEGLSLREYLSESKYSVDEKLETLKKLFSELAKRHNYAIQKNDRDLVHRDPSSGNIICAKNSFYFIDFETPAKKNRPVLESACIEATTTCRWIVRDLGIESIERVLKLLLEAYKGQQILLKTMVHRTTARPFQFFHRWKNKKLKLSHPSEVTKYDIADTLARLEIISSCH
jgi:tRNA A-37 threonylcarbamoyl transferase component Bud32